MPRLNLYVILFALLLYAITAGVTLRDRLLIATLHQIEHNAHAEPGAKNLFEGAMAGMIDTLSDEYDDWYSMYIPPSRQTQYEDELNNRYEGLGLSTRSHKEGEEQQLFVGFPFYDSPAYQLGLRSGDQILQINDTSVADKTNIEILLLLHQPESETRLSVLPFGETAPKDFVVRREKIQCDSVEGEYVDADKRVFHLETLPKIGYIRITSFSNSTADEFESALESMMQDNVESFILDLRDNAGGDVRTCIAIAQMLLPSDSEQHVIVTVHPRSGRERKETIPEGTQLCTLPMAVLIDGDTASASEILAAALQDHGRATIVGTRSFGKGVIQSIVSLPFQSGILQLTDAEYRRPSGAVIHRKKNVADSDDWGVIPDRTVALPEGEQSAVLKYRSLRSNVMAAERSAILERFRRQVIEKQENAAADSEWNQFEFTGTAPYYDLQIDETVKVLLGK